MVSPRGGEVGIDQKGKQVYGMLHHVVRRRHAAGPAQYRIGPALCSAEVSGSSDGCRSRELPAPAPVFVRLLATLGLDDLEASSPRHPRVINCFPRYPDDPTLDTELWSTAGLGSYSTTHLSTERTCSLSTATFYQSYVDAFSEIGRASCRERVF